jgi:hypothetical protein
MFASEGLSDKDALGYDLRVPSRRLPSPVRDCRMRRAVPVDTLSITAFTFADKISISSIDIPLVAA